MDDIRIRKANINDLDQLVDFENACFTSDKMSRESYRSLLKKSSADIFIIELDHQTIGSATLFYRKNSPKARIYSFGIHAIHRERGLAAALHQMLEKSAKQRGCTSLFLEVRADNVKAIQFYKKHGYEAFGNISEFYEDGMCALRMKKSI